MSYSVKWITENLGITRDMLRYYEKEKLLSPNPYQKNRAYSEEDIEKIWGIKLLIGIKFTAKEIYALMHDPKFDFNTAIAQKVTQLEHEYDKALINLEFAKSIKLMGRIPTSHKLDWVKFDDFLDYAHENWNFYDDPRSAPFMKAADMLLSKTPQEWDPADADHLLEIFKSLGIEDLNHTYTLHGYCQVISDMRDLNYDSDTVQRVVHLLHKYLVEHNDDRDFDGKITPQFIAKYIAPFFLSGDIALLHEHNYGKDGCLFIAQALAHYGGYSLDDL